MEIDILDILSPHRPFVFEVISAKQYPTLTGSNTHPSLAASISTQPTLSGSITSPTILGEV